MDLFSDKKVSSYTAGRYEDMRNEILRFSDQQILTCDFEEWADYYESKYYICPITLFEDAIEQDLSETTIKQCNVWHRHGFPEPEYYNVDGYKISFKIPFDGDVQLLYLQPSTYIMMHFPVSSVTAPKDDATGVLVITLENTKGDLKAHFDDISTYVSRQFEETFKNYRTMIEYVNSEICVYNTRLRQAAIELLQKRKDKASDFAAISKAMNIPMKMSKNAPSIKPVPLKRTLRKPVNKPTFREPDPEYCISDQDYNNILNIIHITCSSMEASSRTFIKNDEEELRDFIIATLGTHYENSVSGETFRKIGKTDIQVIFDNKAAFIGECKVWHGIKKFGDAVDQLFGYATWKDSKTALVVFNKENKDFSAIRSSIEKWVRENTKRYTIRNGNMWECVIHRQDTNSDVKIAIAVYDITI